MADRTFLSESVGYNRGHTHAADGGPANTDAPESFAIQWAASPFEGAAKGLTLLVGYGHQAAADADGEDPETRWAVGAGWEESLGDGWTLALISQYQHITHLGGEAGHDQGTISAGARVGFHGWRAGLSHLWILNDADEADEDVNGTFLQASIGYGFALGEAGELGIDLGWQSRNDVEGENDERIGVGVTWHVDL